MGDIFVSDPGVLNAEGETQIGQGEEFGNDIKALYAAVDEIGRQYESAGEQAITNDVHAFQDDLKEMQDMFTKYGTFLKGAAVQTDQNEADIINDFKRHD